MLLINNIRFLSKVQTTAEIFETPEIILKVSIDESFYFQDVTGQTNKNQTVWPPNMYVPVELSPKQNDYLLNFIVYRNGILIGTAKTIIKYGQNIKEQNEVLHNDKTSNGVIVYEGQWYSYSPGANYITYEQFLNIKSGNMSIGKKGVPETTVTATKKQYVRKDSYEDFGGLCSCFSSKKRPENRQPPHQRPIQVDTRKQPIFNQRNAPSSNPYDTHENKEKTEAKKINRRLYIYTEKQLKDSGIGKGENPHGKDPMRKLSYYSKTHHKSG